jgi:hypothetical protein
MTTCVCLPLSGKEFLLPTPLPSQLGSKGLPARFHEDTVRTLLQTEGPTYYWLYKHVMRLMAWAPCGILGESLLCCLSICSFLMRRC